MRHTKLLRAALQSVVVAALCLGEVALAVAVPDDVDDDGDEEDEGGLVLTGRAGRAVGTIPRPFDPHTRRHGWGLAARRVDSTLGRDVAVHNDTGERNGAGEREGARMEEHETSAAVLRPRGPGQGNEPSREVKPRRHLP